MKANYFILFVLLISCNNTDNKQTESTNQEIKKVQITQTLSQIEIVGKATAITSTWKAYKDFITGLENFDHTIASTEQLIIHIDDMNASIPEQLDNQGTKSRIVVLKTRAKSYHSLLTHNEIDIPKQQRRFNLLIKAVDQLKIQLMDAVKTIEQKDNLLKNLEENELELDRPANSEQQ